jgi:hypothetical protein
MKNKNKKDIDTEIDENNKKNIKDDESSVEPEWYHYLIIIGILFLLGYLIYYFTLPKEEIIIKDQNYFVDHPYKKTYEISGKKFNIEYNSPFENISNPNFQINLNKENIWETEKFIFAFYEYNGTDNKYVMKSSVKLMQLFRYVYGLNFDKDSSFIKINSSICENSTIKEKIVVFDPYSNKTGVFYNETNGCISLESQKPIDIVLVGDSLIYSLMDETN